MGGAEAVTRDAIVAEFKRAGGRLSLHDLCFTFKPVLKRNGANMQQFNLVLREVASFEDEGDGQTERGKRILKLKELIDRRPKRKFCESFENSSQNLSYNSHPECGIAAQPRRRRRVVAISFHWEMQRRAQ